MAANCGNSLGYSTAEGGSSHSCPKFFVRSSSRAPAGLLGLELANRPSYRVSDWKSSTHLRDLAESSETRDQFLSAGIQKKKSAR